MREEDAWYQNKYRIKSARYEGYDYSQSGYYFITICTKSRIEYFGKIEKENIVFSKLGRQAQAGWLSIPEHFPFIKLDQFVVMPNHVHGVLIIKVETQNLASLQTSEKHKTQNLASLQTSEKHKMQNLASLQVGDYKNRFGPQSRNLSSVIRGFKIFLNSLRSLPQGHQCCETAKIL